MTWIGKEKGLNRGIRELGNDVNFANLDYVGPECRDLWETNEMTEWGLE